MKHFLAHDQIIPAPQVDCIIQHHPQRQSITRPGRYQGVYRQPFSTERGSFLKKASRCRGIFDGVPTTISSAETPAAIALDNPSDARAALFDILSNCRRISRGSYINDLARGEKAA
jgi:hypothetical protein